MLILKILTTLALLFAAFELTARFGSHCQNKFGFKPADPATVCLWQLYAILFYAGWLWMAQAALAHGDTLNGLLVAGAGTLGAGWLLVSNCRRFRLPYALAATLLQIALAAIIFPPLSLLWLIGDNYANRGTSGAQRVRIEPW
jgi:hypothetical protein